MTIWFAFLHTLFFGQTVPYPGVGNQVHTSGPPSFVNSVANFCTYTTPNCPGPNISVTAGNSLWAVISLHNVVSCTSVSMTATLSGGASLTQIGTITASPGAQSCLARFRINSLPSTSATEHVIFIYTGGQSFASVGEIQSTPFTTVDASCTGTGTSTPVACSSGMTVSNDLLFAAYTDTTLGGTITVGGGFTAAASYAGSGGFTSLLSLGYQRVTMSSTYTPSFGDTGGTLDSAVVGDAIQ